MIECDQEDRRHIDWRLGWIDRRRRELEKQLADLDRQEREVLGRGTKTMTKFDRNLNPTPAAIVAMNVYGKAYSEQRGGSMDFWDKLPQEKKKYCEHFAAAVLSAAHVDGEEPSHYYVAKCAERAMDEIESLRLTVQGQDEQNKLAVAEIARLTAERDTLLDEKSGWDSQYEGLLNRAVTAEQERDRLLEALTEIATIANIPPADDRFGSLAVRMEKIRLLSRGHEQQGNEK